MPRKLYSLGTLASVPMERDISPEVIYSRTRVNEQHPPVTPLDVAPAPRFLGSTSGEPQCYRNVNQASGVPETTSQVLSESSSGTSGAPNTPSVIPSGQGSSAPYMPIPSDRSQNEVPARACSEGINQTAEDTFLEEVVPEKGPMIGGIPIIILGENFPAVPLYVGFGKNWVRAVSRARYHSPYINDAKIYDRNDATPVHCDVLSHSHPMQVS
jgi:hypothetical protein